MFDRLFRAAQQLLGESTTAPAPALIYTGEPVRPRVLLVIHDPPVPSEGGRRLHQVFGWNDPDQLARQYAADLAESSHGYLQYQIVERIAPDWLPVKLDGFRPIPGKPNDLVLRRQSHCAPESLRSHRQVVDDTDLHAAASPIKSTTAPTNVSS